jgi:predicted nucleic acid-binding protein
VKLALDSGIFRNRRFLEWLRYTNKHDLEISIITYVETLLWYKALGLKREDLDQELQSLAISVLELSQDLADKTTANALRHRKSFPFKHHARDYVIGTSALESRATLITYNLDDFNWVKEEGGTVHTPESFLATEIK